MPRVSRSSNSFLAMVSFSGDSRRTWFRISCPGRIDEVFDVMLRSGVESFRCGDRWVDDKHVGETRDLGDGNAMGTDGVVDDVVETVRPEALEGGGVHQAMSSHVDEKIVMRMLVILIDLL